MRRYTSIFVATLFLLLGASSLWATPPSTQSRYIGFSYIQDVSATVSWINGNGAGRVVVISTDATFEAPIASADYSTTNGTILNAKQIGSSNDYVIGYTTGSTRKLDISGLTANTTYYIRIYEYNGTHESYEFKTETATNNPRSFQTKQASLAPPSNLAVAAWSEGGLLSWTDATGAVVGYYLTIYDGGIPVSDYNDLDIGMPSPANFPILGLTANHTYNYSMQSYDAQGNRSANVSSTFTTTTAPAFAITSYTPNTGLQAIEQSLVILLTATNNQIGLSANGITVNGVDCAGTLVDNGNGTYTVTYTVIEGNTYIPNASDLPLSIALKDGNNISSATTSNPVNNTVAPGVDGNYPLAAITAPSADSWSPNALSSITGTAIDAGSGVASVEVAIWIDNDKSGAFSPGDFYWNGSNWTTATTEQWFVATTTDSWANWSYAISIAPPTTLYNKYYIQTRTTDFAGNVRTTLPATHKFYIYNNTEVWVDDSFNGTEDGYGHYKFQKIQDGINEVAATGKVNVAEGTYTEQVLIQKSLILEGAGAANTIVQAPTSGRVTAPGYTSQVWSGDNWSTDYLLAAYPTGTLDGTNLTTRISVKVSGFTFDANSQTHIGNRYTGVYFRRVYNETIENSGLFNCTVKGFNSSDPSATGIRVLESSKLTLSGNTVQGATIQSIVVYGTDNLIDPIVTTTGNTITPLAAAEGIQYRFINASEGYSGIISNNIITGGTHCIAPVSSDHILVDGNNITSGANNGITVESSNYCTIQNNTISNCASNGIALTSPWSATTYNTIIKNTVSGIHSGNTSSLGACGWGIGVEKSSYSVTNNSIGDGTAANANDITNCDAGIVFWNLDNVTNTANGNKIHNNTPYGLGNNVNTITINAENNWWGSANGPVHANNTFNVGAQGDIATDYVDYVPWWGTETGESFAPVYANADGLTTETEQYSSIQTGIDGTSLTYLKAKAGTFTESPNITKSIVLKGAGSTLTTIKSTGTTAVTIGANAVTIDGFEINNPAGKYGIYAEDKNTITITNNIINDIGESDATTSGTNWGIAIVSNAAAVDSVAIKNNEIRNIDGGTFKSADGIAIGWMAGAEDITKVFIENNTIHSITSSNLAYANGGRGAYGILLDHGTAGGQTISPIIKNNTIYDLSGFWSHAIGLEGDIPNALVNGNNIYNLASTKIPSDAVAVQVEANPSAGSITISNNKFGTNVYWGVANVEPTQPLVNAKNNWWGSANGPLNVFDDDPLTIKNPCGGFAYAYGNVDFSPWYYEETMTTKNGLAVATIDPISDITTLNNTPVVIYAKVTFPTGIADFNDAVKVDGVVTSNVAFATGTVIESIKYRGGSGAWSPNLISTPYSIAGKTVVYLSDILGVPPTTLKNEEGDINEYEIVVSGADTVGTFNLTFQAISFITRADDEGCNTVLGEDAFTVTLGSATLSEVGSTAGCNSATVHVKTTYPTIANVDTRILNDSRITSDKTMPAGTQIAWSYNGTPGGTYTLPAATNTILLSTIVGITPPSLNGASLDVDIWDFTISHPDLANNSPYSIAFSPIAVFDGNSDETVDEYVYATGNVNVAVNYQAPDFTTGAATVTGGTVVAGYYNSTNTGIDVVVPVVNNTLLTGGTIQIQVSDDGSNWVNVATSGTHTIILGDLGTNVTVSLADANLTANTEFTEGGTIHFRAVITPATGGCATTGTASATTIIRDETSPTAFTTGVVTTTGGNIVAGYWNSTNTGLTVVVPVASDATLDGGNIELQASNDAFGTAGLVLGAPHIIVSTDRTTGTYTFTIDAATFEALAGFADGNVWRFRAKITDIAGNATTGTASANTLTVDQTVPIVTLTSATTDNVINIAEKAAGFNVVAQSSEATGNLYVWNTTVQGAATDAADLVLNQFGAVAVPSANTNANIAISANNTNIINANVYNVYTIDAAGNMSAPSTSTFTADLVAPTLTGMVYAPNSVSQDGLKKIGDIIATQFAFDQNITVTGNPRVLTNAGTSAYFAYNAVWSGATMYMTYTVVEGESTGPNAFTLNASAIDLNGGTITDAAGNPAVLTISETFDDDYLTNTDITIDGIRPSFTVEYYLGSVTGTPLGVNPIIGIGSSYYIKITANEQLSSTPTISISELAVGPPTNNVTNGSTFTHVANTQFSYNRIVNETVDNGTNEVITITGTDAAGNTASNVAPTNVIPTASPSTTGYQARVDGKRPQPDITLATVDYNDGTNDWTNDSPISATIAYGEAVQNVVEALVSVTNGTKSNFVNAGNTTFTLSVTPTADGDVTVSVPEGDATNQIKDGGGNFAYGASATIKSDRTAPATTDNVPSGWQTADFTVTFTPNDGTGSGVDEVYYTTDGTTPTTSSSAVTSPYQLTITTDGQYTIKYFATDNVGNAESVKTATNTAKLDKTAPAFASGLFTAPESLACWNSGTHDITWTPGNITDPTSGLATNPLSLYYSIDGGGNWILIASGEANDGSYTWNVPTGINSNNCKVQILAIDNAGNTTLATAANSTSDAFSIYDAPTITDQPDNTTACYGAVNNNFIVVATGGGTLTYLWQYSTTGADGTWATVVDETPTGANYTGEATATLNVSGTTIAAGTYYYRVIVNGGCTSSATSSTATLTVNPLPSITLGSNPSVCEGATSADLTYSATTGTPTEYKIDFDATAEGQGFMDVAYTALSASPIPIAVPGAAASGTYNATLTVKNANGCESSPQNITVTVNALPSITLGSNPSVCKGATTANLTYTAAAGANQYKIDFDATANSAGLVDVAYTALTSPIAIAIPETTATGSYNATLQVKNSTSGCESNVYNITVTINPLPVPIISGDNTVNLNTNLTLTTESGMTGYVWSVDGGSITSGSTTNQIAVKWSTSGTKHVTVQYTNTNGCTGTSANFPVTVTEVSAPVISGDPVNKSNICSNTASVQFAVTSVSGVPAPTLTWQYSSDNISFSDLTEGGDFTGVSTTTLTVSNIASHTGYYRLWAHNTAGDYYSASAQLTVTAPVTPEVSITSNDLDNTFCSGTSVTFTATASNTGGGTVAYQWKLNDVNVGSNQNTYTTSTLVNNNKVKCVITITGGCVTTSEATSNEITNTVNSVPAQPSEITGNTTVCAGTSGVAYSVTAVDGVTYAWSYSGSNVTLNGSGASITINFAANATSGTLSVTPHNDCGDGLARTLAITIPASISYSAHPANASITAGENASFSATVTNATSYQWQVSTDNGVTWANATGGVYTNGTTTTLNLTNVPATMNEYKYKLLSSNACQTDIASSVATLSVLATEPSTQASNISWLDWGKEFIAFSWTKGNGSGRLVIGKQATALASTDQPSDRKEYSVSNIFGSGDTVGTAFALKNGDADSVYVSGLERNKAYVFKVFEYNGTGTSINYNPNGATGNPKYRKTNLKETADEFQLVLGDRFSIVGFAPNPVRDQFSFEILTNEALQFTIDVQNEQGLTVYSMSKDLGEGQYPFTIKLGNEYKGQLPAGAYFLRVSSGGETLTQKFIYMP